MGAVEDILELDGSDGHTTLRIYKCHSGVDFEMVHLMLCDFYFHFQNEQTKKASRQKLGVNFISLPSALYVFA